MSPALAAGLLLEQSSLLQGIQMHHILMRNGLHTCVSADLDVIVVHDQENGIALRKVDALQHARCSLAIEPRAERLIHLVQVRGHDTELSQVLDLVTVQPHYCIFFACVSQSVDFVFQLFVFEIFFLHNCHSFHNVKNFSSKMCSITKHLVIIAWILTYVNIKLKIKY